MIALLYWLAPALPLLAWCVRLEIKYRDLECVHRATNACIDALADDLAALLAHERSKAKKVKATLEKAKPKKVLKNTCESGVASPGFPVIGEDNWHPASSGWKDWAVTIAGREALREIQSQAEKLKPKRIKAKPKERKR